MLIVEMDEKFSVQMESEASPVILINEFNIRPEKVDPFLETWASDAALHEGLARFISIQLRRGIARSCVFVNLALWESVAHFGRAFRPPQFQAYIAVAEYSPIDKMTSTEWSKHSSSI